MASEQSTGMMGQQPAAMMGEQPTASPMMEHHVKGGRLHADE